MRASARAYVIEASLPDGHVWTAMANDEAGIAIEMAAAPSPRRVEIHEFERFGDHKNNDWRKVKVWPWKH